MGKVAVREERERLVQASHEKYTRGSTAELDSPLNLYALDAFGLAAAAAAAVADGFPFGAGTEEP